jgi:hypothetical protein
MPELLVAVPKFYFGSNLLHKLRPRNFDFLNFVDFRYEFCILSFPVKMAMASAILAADSDDEDDDLEDDPNPVQAPARNQGNQRAQKRQRPNNGQDHEPKRPKPSQGA